MGEMEEQSTFEKLQNLLIRQKAGFILLIDPDKMPFDRIPHTLNSAVEAGVDVFFIGGSNLFADDLDRFVQEMKAHASGKPVIIFPGSVYQLSSHADAVLFLSLLSGRNPEYLIGQQVTAAPLVWNMGLEAISCAYLLIESGVTTSAQFVSNSLPIPRNKPEISLAHALAAQYLGFKTIYLEGGSGANLTVPDEMISLIREHVRLPLFVGGGIRTAEEAARKVEAGAQFIVVGNFFEKKGNHSLMKEFAQAIHQNR